MRIKLVFMLLSMRPILAGKKGNIRRFRAVFCEYDRKDGAPDFSLKTILYNLNLPLEPTIIIETSPGKYHFYWCVSDDWLATEDGIVTSTMSWKDGRNLQ